MTIRSVLSAAALGLACAALPAPALAHPHIWVDVVITGLFDAEGRVEAVEIQWTYDEFFSLMILEERGLDPDYDGKLTEEETASIQGFDMNWPEGSDGDSYALLGEVPIKMGRPTETTARLEGGYLITSHVRRLDVPVRPLEGAPLIIQSYTPDYYVAYTIMDGLMRGEDESCVANVHGFDPALADAAMLAASQEYAGSEDPNVEFPKIGAAYADEVRITCQPL